MSNPLVPNATHTHVVAHISNYNRVATVPPTANDDSADGYGLGSLWIIPTLNLVYVCTNATVGAAVWQNTSGGQLQTWILSETLPVGTNGALPTYNTWITSPLNTIVGSASANCTLSGSNIVLQPNNSYYVFASAPCTRLASQASTQWAQHRIRLFDVGASTVLAVGSCAASPAASSAVILIPVQNTYSTLFFRIPSSASVRTVAIQHNILTGVGNATNCLYGFANGIAGVPEVYTYAYVWQFG